MLSTQELTAFLNNNDLFVFYDKAVETSCPPVKLISPGLQARFELDDLRVDSVKQMIGKIVRDIMYRRGFEKGVNKKIKGDKVFSSGSTYIKRS